MLPALQVRELGIMLRVHSRHEYLDRVFATFARLANEDRNVTVCIMYDRANAEIISAINYAFERYPYLRRLEMQAPFALVDEKGEHFMEALDIQYEALRAEVPNLDAASLWDDDMWLTPAGLVELNKILDNFDCDRLETRTYFLWDSLERANENFPPHWQALVFRVYPEDRYSTDFMVHCPEYTAFSPELRRMTHRLRNAGYMEPRERQRTWEMFKRAGKIDSHTMVLQVPPRLVELSLDDKRLTRETTHKQRGLPVCSNAASGEAPGG